MLNKFEMLVMTILHLAGFTLYTSEGTESHFFRVEVDSFDEACYWARKVAVLARAHVFLEGLWVKTAYITCGMEENIVQRRWEYDEKIVRYFREVSFDWEEVSVWISTDTDYSYSFTFKVKE